MATWDLFDAYGAVSILLKDIRKVFFAYVLLQLSLNGLTAFDTARYSA